MISKITVKIRNQRMKAIAKVIREELIGKMKMMRSRRMVKAATSL